MTSVEDNERLRHIFSRHCTSEICNENTLKRAALENGFSMMILPLNLLFE
jgi:hypothetical protein